MANIIYSKLVGKNEPMYGEFQHSIRALIQSESDLCEKEKSIVDILYNVEKSKRSSETVIGETDFDSFQAVKEGAGAENDSVLPTFSKTISHIQFMKEFTITKEMADDAVMGMGSNMTNKPKNMARAYYKTRTKLASSALINATKSSSIFNKATLDLTTGDKMPLFSNSHPFADVERFGTKKQSNYFTADFSDEAKLRRTLSKISNRMRNFKDENGENLGYVPDYIILPSNRPDLEDMVKTVVGTERRAGTANNDINTQYGNWGIVILNDWELADGAADELMFMSDEAKKHLLGSMFYNRHPLDVQSFIDPHTRNNVWNAYCRMGVGFNTWKHMSRAVNGTSAATGTTLI